MFFSKPTQRPTYSSIRALKSRFLRLLAVASIMLAPFTQITAQVHGPVIQWHRQPHNQATFVWVERNAQAPYDLRRGYVYTDTDWRLDLSPEHPAIIPPVVSYYVSEFGETEDPVFHARVSGLQPGTNYNYRLTQKGKEYAEGHFRTAPATASEPIRFVAGGDMGVKTAVQISKLAADDDPLFAVVGGDIAYANGRDRQKWYEWIDQWVEHMRTPDGRSIPVILGIGNHEMKSLRDLRGWERITGLRRYGRRAKHAPFYYTFCDLPDGKSNFSVNFGDYMTFLMLDSDHSQKVSAQTDWLAEQLESASDKKHLFAVYHRPAWGTGVKRNLESVQKEWSPLFVEHQVDCVFENDHHVYKRTHPIADGEVDPARGVVYLGDGAWGRTLRPITRQSLRRIDGGDYLANFGSIHHYLRVTLHPDGSRLYEAIDRDDRVFDQYRQTASENRTANASPINDEAFPPEQGTPRL